MPAATSQVVSQLQRSIARAIYGKEGRHPTRAHHPAGAGPFAHRRRPGVGKTTLAKRRKILPLQLSAHQFTSDLLPSDVLGVSVYQSRVARFEFSFGPIFAPSSSLTKINRKPPRARSLPLLEA